MPTVRDACGSTCRQPASLARELSRIDNRDGRFRGRLPAAENAKWRRLPDAIRTEPRLA
jgi:hypothetical protein